MKNKTNIISDIAESKIDYNKTSFQKRFGSQSTQMLELEIKTLNELWKQQVDDLIQKDNTNK